MASGLRSRGVSHLTEGHPETGQRLLLWTSAPLPLRKSCKAGTAICPGQLVGAGPSGAHLSHPCP